MPTPSPTQSLQPQTSLPAMVVVRRPDGELVAPSLFWVPGSDTSTRVFVFSS